eukprot:SAG31_NODE_914_length_11058_cov_13.316270_5_plen_37_part_00
MNLRDASASRHMDLSLINIIGMRQLVQRQHFVPFIG